MSRKVRLRFKRFTFSDASFVSVPTILGGVVTVYAIEARNNNDILTVRNSDEPGETEVYQKCELFKLQEALRTHIIGYDISTLEFSGKTGNELVVEYHT